MNDQVIKEFPCSINNQLHLHEIGGKLCITEKHLTFIAYLFGADACIVQPLTGIVEVNNSETKLNIKISSKQKVHMTNEKNIYILYKSQ